MSKVELTCPEILTPEDVAEILRLPVKTIRARIADKSLKGTKIGKHWRVYKKDLERYLS